MGPVSFLDQVQSVSKEDSIWEPLPKHLEIQMPLSKHNEITYFSRHTYIPSGGPWLEIDLCHDTPLAGHFGHCKISHIASHFFCLPRMRTKIQAYIDSCKLCACLWCFDIPRNTGKALDVDFTRLHCGTPFQTTTLSS